MSDLTPLIRDLCGSLAEGPRAYDDVLEAWRTSCPRLTVWEDAVDLGYVERRWLDGVAVVALTDNGRAFLDGRLAPAGTAGP